MIRSGANGPWRSLASALAWGARGPGFKSRRPDQINPLESIFTSRPNRTKRSGVPKNVHEIAQLALSVLDKLRSFAFRSSFVNASRIIPSFAWLYNLNTSASLCLSI